MKKGGIFGVKSKDNCYANRSFRGTLLEKKWDCPSKIGTVCDYAVLDTQIAKYFLGKESAKQKLYR